MKLHSLFYEVYKSLILLCIWVNDATSAAGTELLKSNCLK